MKHKNRWQSSYPAACNTEVTFVSYGVEALTLLKQFIFPSNLLPAQVRQADGTSQLSTSVVHVFLFVC